MFLSLFGLKASGLRRRHVIFILLARFFRRSLKTVYRFLISLLLLVFFLTMIAMSNREDSYLHRWWQHLSDGTVRVVYVLQSPFIFLQQHLKNQVTLIQRVQDLENENRQLRFLYLQMQSYQQENEQLRTLLNILPEDRRGLMNTVRVLGSLSDHYSSSLIVAADPDLNLLKNQVVMTAEGVVGRILSVGLRTARVLLITDSRSRIPARIQSTGEHVILIGDNSPQLKVLHLAQSALDNGCKPHPGDIVVTSGYGGIYPPDLPIARITDKDGETFTAEVLFDRHHLDYVMIFKSIFPALDD